MSGVVRSYSSNVLGPEDSQQQQQNNRRQRWNSGRHRPPLQLKLSILSGDNHQQQQQQKFPLPSDDDYCYYDEHVRRTTDSSEWLTRNYQQTQPKPAAADCRYSAGEQKRQQQQPTAAAAATTAGKADNSESVFALVVRRALSDEAFIADQQQRRKKLRRPGDVDDDDDDDDNNNNNNQDRNQDQDDAGLLPIISIDPTDCYRSQLIVNDQSRSDARLYQRRATAGGGGDSQNSRPAAGGNGRRLRSSRSETSLRMSAKRDLLLSDKEIYQIEIMNSGLSALRVYVCHCLANLYFDNGPAGGNDDQGDVYGDRRWRRAATGVPVAVLESDPDRSPKRRFQVLIRLAEFGNGFRLWEDALDPTTRYRCDRTFHTMTTVGAVRPTAGLSFDSQSGALKFSQQVQQFQRLAADLQKQHGDGKRVRSAWSPFRRAPTAAAAASSSVDHDSDLNQNAGRHQRDSHHLKKTDISQPCCFKHVTCLKADQAVLPDAVGHPSLTNAGHRTLVSRTANGASQCSINELRLVDIGSSDGPRRAQSCMQILTAGDCSSTANGGRRYSNARMAKI